MPNSIKYNTESEANALRVGNMHIGTGDVPKGPTTSTGFYNGINPPNGGYTIYLNKATPGPSIYTPSSDAELILITNQIAGASYTTINECFNYFASQNGKMVMYNPINPIVTDELIFYVNAGVIPSYPHNNNTWIDLGEDNNNGTLTNGPTFNSNGYLDFDGVDDYITLGSSASSLVQGKTSISMGILFKLDALDSLRGLIGTLNYNCQKNLGLTASGTTLQFYNDNTSCNNVSINGGAEVNKWIYAVGTYDGTTTRLYCLKDGNLTQASGTNKSGATNTFTSEFRVMGPFHSYRTNGQCANAFVYDKVLSSSEILQNYYQAPIVTDGLVTALDFSNLVSYESGSSSGYSLTGSVGFDLFNSPTDTSNFGGGIKCEEIDEFIALDDVTATDYVTVEVWYTRDSAGSGEDIVFNKESCWEIRDDGGNINWAVKANNKNWFWYDSTANIAVGETVQFVLTYDGNYVKSYKNGDLVQTYTYPSGGVLTSQTSCYPKLNSRSCSRTSVSNPGNHTFYQFRIYDRALTDEEVTQNYNANINKFN